MARILPALMNLILAIMLFMRITELVNTKVLKRLLLKALRRII